MGDLIKKETSQIIQQELKDPGIGFVTVTGVEVSADLKRARIYYSVLGDENSKRESASALRRASGFIQHEIGQRLQLRYTPEISFEFDGSVEYGARIEALIRKIHHEYEPDDKEIPQNEFPEDQPDPRKNGE